MPTYGIVRATIGFATILASISIPAAAAEYPQKLTWEEASYIVNKSVRIVMPDGAVLEGMAQAFNSEEFVLDARYIEGAIRLSQSTPHRAPRTSIKTLQIGDLTNPLARDGGCRGYGYGCCDCRAREHCDFR